MPESGEEIGPEERLRRLGIELPPAPRPFGPYVTFAESGPLAFLSGMVPVKDDVPQHIGTLGRSLSADHGSDLFERS
jgi:hypothetical protein